MSLLSNLWETNRLVKELMRGGLSKSTVAAAKPFLRSKDRMVQGLEKGVANRVAKGKGAYLPKSLMSLAGGGGLTTAGQVHVIGNSPAHKMGAKLVGTLAGKGGGSIMNSRDFHAARAATAAHEGHEFSALGNLQKAVSKGRPFHGVAPSIHNNKLVGMHMSPAVLGHEMNDIRRLKVHGADMTSFEKSRRNTGEAGMIKRVTGKDYGQTSLTRRDIGKLGKMKPVSRRIGDMPTSAKKALAMQPAVIHGSVKAGQAFKDGMNRVQHKGLFDKFRRVLGGAKRYMRDMNDIKVNVHEM